MGYTHYWRQRRDLTKAQWATLSADIADILRHVGERGVVLGNAEGEPGTATVFDADEIAFNGVGTDAHETFTIRRTRRPVEFEGDHLGGDFCKTAEKPYDLAATACLCYLATITRRDDPATGEPIVGTEAWRVTSDGNGAAFLAGLDVARQALPRLANRLDIPMPVMEADRWVEPWVDHFTDGYRFRFCVDGRAYITRRRDGASYCFPDHTEAEAWLKANRKVLSPTGTFDQAGTRRLATAQTRLFKSMVDAAPDLGRDQDRPPAFIRPGRTLAAGLCAREAV